jgi:pimeloyl-ACP methyl ester carboxylesterase
MGEYLEVNGLKTFFERRGSGEPVLLLHGGGCTIETLYAQAEELARLFDVVLPERRWHGRTASMGTDLTYEIMTTDTVAFMDKLGIRNAHLIGHSDGANIAALITLQRPDLVRKLVMISGNFNTDYMSAEKKTSFKLTPEDIHKWAPSVFDLYYKVTPNASVQYPVLLEMLKKLYTSDWRIPTASLGRIAVPTLIVSAD